MQYADDTTMFLDDSKTSITETIRIFSVLKEASGLSINLAKSNLFPLGPYITRIPFSLHDLNIDITHGPVQLLGICFTNDENDLFPLNYTPKLSRLKNCLKSWSMRDLTPIGRNVIVKSFALSQLVFLFQVLPNPPNHFIREIDQAIYDFIWGGNPDKVKRSTIINTISEGGLKVTHVPTFIKSLKCTWVKRYCKETAGIWALFFNLYLKPYGYDFIFRCNYCKKDIQTINNVFIRQVLEAWSDVVFTNPSDNYGSQIIWNNSYIRVNNDIVMYKNLFQKNVTYVSDFFDDNNLPLTMDRFKQLFKIEAFPFTLYWGLINAIPQTWRRSGCIRTLTSNATIDFLNKTMQSTSVSQFIYKNQLNRLSNPPTSKQKWQGLFNTLTNSDWRRFFTMPHLSVSEARLRYFQFKFLHRIIPTSKLLFSMGKSDSDLCSFCGIATESIEHLFWECSHTASFILDVEGLILKKQFCFSKQTFFFGYGNSPNHAYNFLILHMKYYIFDCKRKDRNLSVDDFFFRFKFALNIEKYNNNRIYKKNKKKKNKVNYNDLLHAFSACQELFF